MFFAFEGSEFVLSPVFPFFIERFSETADVILRLHEVLVWFRFLSKVKRNWLNREVIVVRLSGIV